MARNKYTRAVRKEEFSRFTHEEREFERLARELRGKPVGSTDLPVVSDDKQRRYLRRKETLRRKAAERGAADPS